MDENIIKESKAIRILFQELMNDNYKQKGYRNRFVVSVLPEKVNNDKYLDFERNILKNNSYNVINKYILALSKLYLYDEKIFKLIKGSEDSVTFESYNNDLDRFIDDAIFNLSVSGNKMDLIFNELKIGLEITSWSIKVMDFGCINLKFVMDMFKSEGLFIKQPFI